MDKNRQEINDNLAAMVKRRFDAAELANRDFYDRAKACTLQMEGSYIESDVDSDDLLDELTMNITSPIVVGFLSMLEEILDPLGNQPFSLAPTPIAELPPELEEDIRRTLENNLPALAALVGGDVSQLQNLKTALRETTKSVRNDKANKAAARLTEVVRDKLTEAGFSSVLSDFLYNYLVYPTAFLKGPFYVSTQKKTWTTWGMSYTPGIAQKVEVVSPFNLLPAPHARDLHSCPYVIERMRMHSNDLLDLITTSSYDADAIVQVIDDYDKYIIPYACDMTIGTTRQPDEEETVHEDPEHIGYYDVLVHYGQVQGKYLEEYGVEVEDPRRMYESEIWLVGSYVIRATLRTPGRQARPFYSASYLKSPGKLFGKSAVEVVRDAQVQCTEAARSLARNMRFASGPIGEVVAGEVVGTDDPEVIYPLMMKAVKRQQGTLPTYRFHTVPSNAEQLLGVYKHFSNEAYVLIGIPPLAYGNTTGVATLGRTSGGVAMVMNQASKPVKRAMGILEQSVIRKVIEAFVDYEMMVNPDEDLRGDVQVIVQGVQSIADKETKEGKIEWIFQSLASAVGAGLVPKDVWLRLLRTIFEDNNIDTHGLPSFKLQDALTDDLQNVTDTDPNVPASGSNPTANLDGRSQVAIDQIQQSNGGSGL